MEEKAKSGTIVWSCSQTLSQGELSVLLKEETEGKTTVGLLVT